MKESVVVIWLNKSTISILDFTSNTTVYRCGREMVGLITFNHPFLHTERKIIPTLEFASDDL